MNVFVCAMACEAEAVVSRMTACASRDLWGRPVVEGRLGGVPTAVITCGVGKTNAAAGAQLALSEFKAEAILNAGVAGGLDPSMKPFQTYSVARAVQYDFDLSSVNGTVPGVLNEYDTPFFELEAVAGFPTAVCATGDTFSDREEDAAELFKAFGATVRDMELGAIAHVGRRAGVPVRSLKTLTDVVGAADKMTSQYQTNLKVALAELARHIPAFFGTEAVRA